MDSVIPAYRIRSAVLLAWLQHTFPGETVDVTPKKRRVCRSCSQTSGKNRSETFEKSSCISSSQIETVLAREEARNGYACIK
nr:uncharacterized protein CTRU02_01113 [Colletotrichum truncatum]KAF6800708.1 hypothetical protein CTRU02_01113 [Colletotrichum truncatum]